MSDVSSRLEAFYTPTLVGKVVVAGNSACFGWATGLDNELVAVSVMGGSTSIEAIWASIITGESISVMRDEDDTGPYWSSRYAQTSSFHYKKHAKAVPNSSYVSMIMVNTSLESYIPSSKFAYVPHISKEDLKERFFERVKQICYMPVLEPWTDYLMEVGKNLDNELSSMSIRDRLCGEIDVKSTYWLAKGFNIFWIRNNRTFWEQVIIDGLKRKKISIHAQNSSEKV